MAVSRLVALSVLTRVSTGYRISLRLSCLLTRDISLLHDDDNNISQGCLQDMYGSVNWFSRPCRIANCRAACCLVSTAIFQSRSDLPERVAVARPPPRQRAACLPPPPPQLHNLSTAGPLHGLQLPRPPETGCVAAVHSWSHHS
jgi:hypothetical protein